MIRTTDPDSAMESAVALSMPPASSTLPLLAALDAHAPLAQPSATSSLMLLTFIRHNMAIVRIDNLLPYNNPYAKTLPYSDDTPMGDN
jgi:hypothetical protein